MGDLWEFKYSEEYGLKKRIIKDILITSSIGTNILFRENLWLSLNSVKEVFKCDDPKSSLTMMITSQLKMQSYGY